MRKWKRQLCERLANLAIFILFTSVLWMQAFFNLD
jgi:hypothetical protein